MDKTAYLELKAKFTNDKGEVDWTGFNAAKPKSDKASKPASSKASAPKAGNGPVVVSKAYTKPATPKELAPVAAKTPSYDAAYIVQNCGPKALSREANVAALLRSIADLIEGK